MRAQVFSLAASAALALAPASEAHAQITLNAVPEAVDTSISGSGGPPNGAVELYINNVSQGSVFTDASGNFTFSGLSLALNDVIDVEASYAWNFNTNGDTEGWTETPANHFDIAASGGVLTGTVQGADPGMSIDLSGYAGGGILGSTYRAVEIRYRQPGASAAANSLQIFFQTSNPAAGYGVNQRAYNLPTNTAFQTVQFSPVFYDADEAANSATPYDNDSNWAANANTLITSIRLDPAGALNTGETIEIDWIRIKEYISFEFREDGDFMALNRSGVSGESVSGGVYSFTATGADAWAGFNHLQSWIDTTVFTRYMVGMTATSASTLSEILWQDTSGSLGAGTNNLAIFNATHDGTFREYDFDMTTATHVGGTPSTWDNPIIAGPSNSPRFDFIRQSATGDTAAVEYIRLAPAGTLYGPTDPVTITTVPVELDLFMVE